MKIALYTSADLYKGRQTGGIKRFAELTEYISKSCLNYMLFSRDEENSLIEHGVKCFSRLKDVGLKGLLPPEFQYLWANVSVIESIKKENYDNVIIFDVPTATGPLLYGLKNVVLMIRKDMIGYEKVQNRSKAKWLKICFQWLCESICMSRAKLIITQCDYDKNVLKERHPFLAKAIEKKTVVQINNVNPSWIVTKSEMATDNANLLGNKDKFRICFIGGFGNPRKGQDLFLAAAEEIVKECKDMQFILIGGGNRLDVYKKKYESDNIMFLGRQDNPLGILKQCDLLVVPSLADSCPNTVMEALYNEVPVIGGNAGGIPEILLHENALFELNVSSLKECIQKYKDNNKALHELKEQQKHRKDELTFDWAARIIKIISEPK